MENIKIVKLKNNEDIVCGYVDNVDYVTMTYPMIVYIEQDLKKMTQNLIMHFWLPFNLVESQDVDINKSDILAIVEPKNEFKEYYLNYIHSLDEDNSKEFDKEELKILLEKMDAKHFNKVH